MATITSPRAQSPGDIVSSPAAPRSPSLAGTPTSSFRPSVDLPRNGAARSSSPAPATTKTTTVQRRNRAALRDYYNLKSKESATGSNQELRRTESSASNASDSTATSSAPQSNSVSTSTLPSQLDDPSFDPDAYVADILKSSNLRDLLRTESALVSEIRNLDGERKALVYDNYSKLIKAVSTIGEMQRGMQKDETQGGLNGVEKLETRLQGLAEVVKGLPSHTQPGRDLARKEVRNKRQQQKAVRWVLEAPYKLRELVEQGKRDEAEAEWKAVKALLEKWEGVQGVSEVRSACEKVMATDEEEDEEDDEDEDEEEVEEEAESQPEGQSG